MVSASPSWLRRKLSVVFRKDRATGLATTQSSQFDLRPHWQDGPTDETLPYGTEGRTDMVHAFLRARSDLNLGTVAQRDSFQEFWEPSPADPFWEPVRPDRKSRLALNPVQLPFSDTPSY